MSRGKGKSERFVSAAPASAISPWHRYAIAAMALLIVAVTTAAYLPALHGAFILDDDKLLTENSLVKAQNGLSRLWFTTESEDYYPVVYTAFRTQWRWWGMNPTGYHIVNLTLHIISVLLIWVVLSKLSVPGAYLAAFFFAVHPVNVESVAWIAQQRNMLAIVFFLLAILAYLQIAAKGWLWYVLSLLAFTLGMLSKASIAILPLILLLIVWWQRGRITRGDIAKSVPFFLVAAALAGVNVWFQTHGSNILIRDVSWGHRLAGAGAAVWFYLSKAILPIDLVFVFPPWQIHARSLLWWLPMFAAIAITIVLWSQRNSNQAKWDRPLLFAWAFFAIALLPALGFTDVGFMRFSLVANHYQHIALIGVAALVAAGISIWQNPRSGITNRPAMAIAAVIIVALAALTWRQSKLYGNPIALYEATLAVNPENPLIENNLGNIFLNNDQPQLAIEHYRKALQYDPDYELAHNNLGYALVKVGKISEATEQYQRALALNPEFASAHSNWGAVLLQSGQGKQAAEQYELAVRFDPESARAHYNFGNSLTQIGRTRAAIIQFEQAIALQPDYPKAHNNLGLALLNAGQQEEAVAHFQQAVQFNPSDPMPYANMAIAYAALHRPTDAVASAKKAIELARSHGPPEMVSQMESFLANYAKSPANPPEPAAK